MKVTTKNYITFYQQRLPLGDVPLIRDALFNHEDYAKADELTKKMQGLFSESYMPLGIMKFLLTGKIIV